MDKCEKPNFALVELLTEWTGKLLLLSALPAAADSPFVSESTFYLMFVQGRAVIIISSKGGMEIGILVCE